MAYKSPKTLWVDLPTVSDKTIILSSPVSQPLSLRFPEILYPKVNSPKVDSPKISSPKLNSLKISSPKVNSPKVSSPKVNSPKISSPKITIIPLSGNYIGIPNPKVNSSKVSSPKIPIILNRKANEEYGDFIKPLDIHKEYGVIDIPGIEVVNIEKSTHADKKYAITVKYQGITKTVHYGNSDYQQYHDRTPIKAFTNADHNDEKRRRSYLARASKIMNSMGLAANDPFSANRYAIITLW